MQITHLRRTLRDVVVTDDPNSFALVSTADDVETAVIFVHGFGGSPGATWSHFELIDRLSNEDRSWMKSDLFFYGYKSISTPLLFSADKFLRFLRAIFPDPPTQLLSRPRPHSMLFLEAGVSRIRATFSRYSRLIIAAHSEGAAVVRRSLCDLGIEFAEELQLSLDPSYRRIDLTDTEGAVQLKPRTQRDPNLLDQGFLPLIETPEARNSKIKLEASKVLGRPDFLGLGAELKLFAPAHCGSLITGKLGLLLALFRNLHAAFIGASIAAVELDRRGGVIGSLKSETEELAVAYPYLSAFRADILWGERDEIVDKQKFRFDRFEVVAGHNHTSVCKPSSDYLEPITFVQRQPHAGSATI